MTDATLDLSLFPPLGEPRPQPVPEAARDDAAQRPAAGRRPAPRRPADRAAAAGAVRRADGARGAASTPPAAPCSPAPSCWAPRAHDQTGIAELLQGHGAELSVSGRPRPAAVRHDACSPAASHRCSACSPSCSPTPPTRTTRSRASATASPSGSRSPGRSPASSPAPRWPPAATATTRTPSSCPTTDLVVGGRRRRRCARLHRERVLPAGSSLVLVGDLDPRGRATWSPSALAALVGDRARGRGAAGTASCGPPAIGLVDRPGAVQSNLRLGGPAPGRTDPDLPAVRLANMIFGGYFSSRLVENIRERRGLHLQPAQLASTTRRPARRSSSRPTSPPRSPGRRCWRPGTSWAGWPSPPVTDAELDGARRYILGSMALSTATHAGLASTLSALIGAGLPAGWLAEHQQALAAVTVEEVQDVSLPLPAPPRPSPPSSSATPVGSPGRCRPSRRSASTTDRGRRRERSAPAAVPRRTTRRRR